MLESLKMRTHRVRSLASGFTLIELLVVIALLVVVLAVAVPGFSALVVNQRLKSVNAQLVTDLQFARSEAAARNKPVFFSYRANTFLQKTCYSIYVPDSTDALCNCISGSCAGVTKLKTVELPFSGKVRYTAPGTETGDFAFDSVSGGLLYGTSDFVDETPTTHQLDTVVVGDTSRNLRTIISPAGRPTVCSAGSKLINGFSAC